LKCPDASEFESTYIDSYDKFEELETAYASSFAGSTPQYTTVLPAAYPLTKTTGATSVAEFGGTTTGNTGWRRTVYKEQSPTEASNDCGTADWSQDATCMEGSAPKCPSGSTLTPPSTDVCYQRAILITADLMWSSSYLASCHYLNEAARAAVADGGSCNKLGNGFVNLFVSHGLIGFFWFCIVLITLYSHKVWSNYEEDVEASQVEAIPPQDGVEMKVINDKSAQSNHAGSARGSMDKSPPDYGPGEVDVGSGDALPIMGVVPGQVSDVVPGKGPDGNITPRSPLAGGKLPPIEGASPPNTGPA